MRPKDKNIYILTALVILFGIINYYVIKNDHSYLYLDMMGYFRFGAELAQALATKGLRVFFEYFQGFFIFSPEHFKPPFLVMFSIPFYLLFGITQITARMINVLFIFILVFSVYFSGKRLQNKTTGLVACVILLSFPAIIGHSRLYFLDFSLTCLVALSFCLLIYTDFFQNRLFAIFLGISSGLGILTKQTFVIFTAPIIIYYVYLSFKKCMIDRRAEINIVIFLITGFIIAAGWYLPNLTLNLSFFGQCYSFTALYGNESWSLFGRFYNYIEILHNYQLHGFFFYSFLLAVFLFLFSKKSWKSNILFLWVMFPILFFPIMNILTSVRYTLPMLPGIALFLAFSAGKLRNLNFRRFVYVMLIGVGILGFIFIHFDSKKHYSDLAYFLRQDQMEGLIVSDKNNWRIEEVLSKIVKSKNQNDEITVGVMPQCNPIVYGLRYVSFIKNLPIEITYLLELPKYYHGQYISMDSYINLLKSRPKSILRDYDYIILLEAPPNSSSSDKIIAALSPVQIKLYNFLEDELKRDKPVFHLVDSIDAPYGLKFMIYQKNDFIDNKDAEGKR